MRDVVLIASAALWSAATSGLAAMQLWRLRRERGDAEGLARALKRVPVDERAGKLGALAKPGTHGARIAAACTDPTGATDRVAQLNDVLGDVDHAIDVGRNWPDAAVRLGAFGAMLLAALAFVVSGGRAMLLAAIAALPGIVVPVALARRAKREAAGVRSDIDALVDALTGGSFAAAEASRRDAQSARTYGERRGRGPRGRRPRAPRS